MWLFSGFQDEVFTIAIQIVLENRKGLPVQGEYETVDADHFLVRSAEAGADRGIVIEQTYDHGT